MYAGRDFDRSDVGENELYSFDFVNDIAGGLSITGSTWTISVMEGVDATPSSRLQGSPIILGTVVSHRISGLLEDVTYRVQCKANLSDSSVVSLWSNVESKDPMND